MKYILSLFLGLVFYIELAAQSFNMQPSSTDPCLKEAMVALPPGFRMASCQPYVIQPGESFGMYIQLDQNDYKQLDIASNAFNGLKFNNQTVTVLTLKDDGTQGDLQSGDNIFSVFPLSLPSNPIIYPSQWFLRYCDLTFTTKGGNLETQNVDLAFGVRIIPANTPLPLVKKINDSVQYTEYILNFTGPMAMMNNRQAITKSYYSHFPDDRDFIIRSTTYPTPGTEIPAANFFAVKNTVTGIYGVPGNSLFDRTAEYGSASKLQGYINMFFTQGGHATLLNHEILHNWACFIDTKLKISDNPHWGFTVFPSSGFGFGSQIKSFMPLTDTTYATTFVNSGIYNSLELYLMGLMPADSISFPVQALMNASIMSTAIQGHVLKASGVQEVNRMQFFNSMAVRSPGVSASQKLFKAGSVVLSDRLLTPKELSYYHELMKENENKNQSTAMINAGAMNFYSATRGKAELTTKIANLTTPVADSPILHPVFFYPNPAYDKLHYKQIPLSGDWVFKILDANGITTLQGRIDGTEIDLSRLHTGIYFILLSNSLKTQITQKIVLIK